MKYDHEREKRFDRWADITVYVLMGCMFALGALGFVLNLMR